MKEFKGATIETTVWTESDRLHFERGNWCGHAAGSRRAGYAIERPRRLGTQSNSVNCRLAQDDTLTGNRGQGTPKNSFQFHRLPSVTRPTDRLYFYTSARRFKT
jgi:hypothetical protein